MDTTSSENSHKPVYTDTEKDVLIKGKKEEPATMSKLSSSFKKLYFISLAFDVLGLFTIIADITVGVCLENDYVVNSIGSILMRFLWVLIMNHVPGTF